MYYKEYGNTGLKVSAIGFGGMRFNDDDVRAGNFDKCAQVPLYAHAKGINYFDTAPHYNDDKSEIIMGMALSQLKRDSYFLSSKTNMETIGKVVNRDTYRERLETTLTRLKTDYLDFYHLWCVLSPEKYETEIETLYSFFEEAKSEGLIRNIVFSSHMEGNQVAQVIEDGRFAGVLLGYNAINYKFRQEGVIAASQKGMGVVIMNPLGGGLIPQNPDMFSYLAKDSDLNVSQAGLRFVASHKEVTITLAGCTNFEQVDNACRAVEGLVEKPALEIEKDLAANGMKFNNLCTGCGYCKHCPMDIDIPKFMDAYNMKLLKGEDMKNRLDGMWGTDSKIAQTCIACGKCEKLCTQHLPIINRLKEIGEL